MIQVIFIHIKVLRGNFFLLISNNLGKLILNKSCGSLGFKNIEKRTKDAFQNLLFLGIQFILNLDKKHKLFIKIEGAKKEFLQQIFIDFINVLQSYNIQVFAIKLINKVVHNGCRKPSLSK